MTTLFRSIAAGVRAGGPLPVRSVGRSTLDAWRSQGLVTWSEDAPNWVTLTPHGYAVMVGGER